jgi:PAS domain S-box-containing protein
MKDRAKTKIQPFNNLSETRATIAQLEKVEIEHSKTEEALLESKERFRLTLEATNDGLWDWNIPTGKAVLSPRYYTMLGYEPYEFPQSYECFRSLVHPDDFSRAEQEINEHIRRDEGYAIEIRMRTKTGDWVWILTRGKVVEHDADGRPVRMVGTHTDVTDRKQAEEALMESEARFRAAFETSAIGMALVALDGRYLRANRSLCITLGYSEEELLNKTFQEITHPDDLENDLEHRRRLMRDDIPDYRIEKRYHHSDGYIIWGSLSVAMVRDSWGHPLYYVVQVEDITERKLAEEKVRRTSVMDDEIIPSDLPRPHGHLSLLA